MSYMPYAYLIGWTKENKWYYGIQYGKKAHPKNLWNTYFTSSDRVKKLREETGEPDVIEIRKTFTYASQAQEWEKTVLRRMKVLQRKEWLNQNIAGRAYNPHRPEHSALLKQRYKEGRHFIPEKAHAGHHHSAETKKLLSKKAKIRFSDKQKHPFWGYTKYKVISPNGEIFIVDGGWTYWCKERNLNHADLRKVALGKRNHSKGWRAEIL